MFFEKVATTSQLLLQQVLSETVSKALQLTGGTDVRETVKFVEMFDKFFDSLNVNSYNAGRLKRKVFKQPFRSATDFRLKVHVHCVYYITVSLWVLENIPYSI